MKAPTPIMSKVTGVKLVRCDRKYEKLWSAFERPVLPLGKDGQAECGQPAEDSTDG